MPGDEDIEREGKREGRREGAQSLMKETEI